MTAQKGSDLVVKIGDGASPEVFTNFAGLRTKSMDVNAETVDITNSDSTSKWRELLAGAGIKSMAVSGSGVFLDAAVDTTLQTELFAQTHPNFQVVVPDFGTFEGAFQLSSRRISADHNAEVQYEFQLESAGVIAFTAA